MSETTDALVTRMQQERARADNAIYINRMGLRKITPRYFKTGGSSNLTISDDGTIIDRRTGKPVKTTPLKKWLAK